MSLVVGQTYVKEVIVTEEMSADRAGNAGIMVLATPILVGLVERCCIEAITPSFEAGQASVGTSVAIEHIAPTPLGFTVSLTSTLTAIEGRSLTFEVTATDGRDTICRCTHKRALINVGKFLERVSVKASAA